MRLFVRFLAKKCAPLSSELLASLNVAAVAGGFDLKIYFTAKNMFSKNYGASSEKITTTSSV